MAFEEAASEENVIGNWTKEDIFNSVAKAWATISPAVMWELENESNKIDDLVKGIFSQSVKGAVWFLLAVYGQRREGEDKLKDGLLN